MRHSNASQGISSTMLIACLGHFLTDLFLGIWPIFKTIHGLDLGLAGLITAFCILIGEGMQLFFGSLNDQGHGKKVLIFSLFFIGGTALLPYGSGYMWIILAYFLTAIGSGAFHPTGAACAAWAGDKSKGLYLSIFSATGYLGLAVSQVVYKNTYHLFRGNTALLLLPCVLLALYVCFFYDFPKRNKVPSKGLKDVFHLFKNRDLRNLYFALVCNQIVFWTLIFLLPDFLVSRIGPGYMSFGGAHLALLGGGALMMIPSGYLADRISEKHIMLVAGLVSLLSYYFFLFQPALPTLHLTVLLLVLGGSTSLILPVAVANGNRIVPARPGLVSALLMGLVWCVSETIGPVLGGFLASRVFEGGATSSLMVIGLFGLVSLYFLSQLSTKQSTEEADIVLSSEGIASENLLA